MVLGRLAFLRNQGYLLNHGISRETFIDIVSCHGILVILNYCIELLFYILYEFQIKQFILLSTFYIVILNELRDKSRIFSLLREVEK